MIIVCTEAQRPNVCEQARLAHNDLTNFDLYCQQAIAAAGGGVAPDITLTSVTPNHGPEGTPVIVHGSGFLAAPQLGYDVNWERAPWVWWGDPFAGGSYIEDLDNLTDTSFSCSGPAGEQPGDLYLVSAFIPPMDLEFVSLLAAFTIEPSA